MGFKDFLTEKNDGTYVEAKFSKDTINRLYNGWVKEQDFGSNIKLLNKDDYHCTILYSRKFIPKEFEINDYDKHFCKPKEFKIFQFGKQWCLVLVIECKELNEIHKNLIKAGGTHDYDEFIPHVTLCLFDNKNDIDISKLELPKMTLEIVEIKTSPLDLDFSY
jgi:hypothetical protein